MSADAGARRSRTIREYRLLGQALAATAIARVGLLILPLATVRRAVRWLAASSHPLAPGYRCSPEQVIRASVSAGLHSPLGTTCLATALVAQAMLQHHGHDARLRVGVRRDANGAFRAHAWLERDGRVVVGGPLAVVDSYTLLPKLEHLIR
jgi:Transglutaminase-like superfamily